MSVLKNKRAQSSVQFLETAKDLHIFTMRTCEKYIPKAYTFYISIPMQAEAETVIDFPFIIYWRSICNRLAVRSRQSLDYFTYCRTSYYVRHSRTCIQRKRRFKTVLLLFLDKCNYRWHIHGYFF